MLTWAVSFDRDFVEGVEAGLSATGWGAGVTLAVRVVAGVDFADFAGVGVARTSAVRFFSGAGVAEGVWEGAEGVAFARVGVEAGAFAGALSATDVFGAFGVAGEGVGAPARGAISLGLERKESFGGEAGFAAGFGAAALGGSREFSHFRRCSASAADAADGAVAWPSKRVPGVNNAQAKATQNTNLPEMWKTEFKIPGTYRKRPTDGKGYSQDATKAAHPRKSANQCPP